MAVDKRNIFLSDTVESMDFLGTARPIKSHYPRRDVPSHADFVQKRLNECYERSDAQRQAAAIRYKEGVYLEFSGASGYELCVKSLENRKQGIRLLNVQQDEESDCTKATVYIPAGKENYFLEKAEKYATQLTQSGNPKNSDLLSSIEDIRLAMLESFWIGEKDKIPADTAGWCELWLRYEFDSTKDVQNTSWERTEASITRDCEACGIPIDEKCIVFPERIVKLICADGQALQQLISMNPFITEIRPAPVANTFFEKMTNTEQEEWVDDLLSRTTFEKNGVTVCLLDTGVSYWHPLLEPATAQEYMQAVETGWGTDDKQGHGTRMAGVALYNDLKAALESTDKLTVPHELESVKILPPKGGNPPELYGSVTERAVYTAEITNPQAKRVLCMAVTAPYYNTDDGSPSSWSADIDNITSGANEEDEKRLFLISAGNVQPSELLANKYPDANILHRVENPGQSWNAVTVGAYAGNVIIENEDYAGYQAVAEPDALSPYSSSSMLWNQKWPVKPDVVFDGGNVAFNGDDYTECEDLELLTTDSRPHTSQFTIINGTSAATAQAAWFCARILDEYPDIWPETVRALMIHSAEWTPAMRRQFCSDDTKTKGRHQLLRMCGYGIPDLQKAIQCMDNSVNMVIQGELQPYNKDGMNEMHIHTLPWPKETLRSLGEVPVTLRVTLSYFIEPGPGEVGWKDKYRYPSYALKFDLNNANETEEDFKKRMNIKARGDDKKDSGEGSSGSERWYLGQNNRDVGSVHSDYCTVSAVELSECNMIAVYPIGGWWKERKHLKRYDKKARYSLVVTLSTPKADADLYTPIITQITPMTEITI